MRRIKETSDIQKKDDAPTPHQISFSPPDESQWQADLEAQRLRKEMENYLDKSDEKKVKIEELELLMGQEDAKVCLKYILAHARRRGSRIFEIFSTKQKIDHSVASRNRLLEYQGKRVSQQERSQSDWQDVNWEGPMAEAPPCPGRRMRTLLPQQSSSSTKKAGGVLEKEPLWRGWSST